MKIVGQESTVFCDVDDTLVMWKKAKKGQKAVAVTSPHDGQQTYLLPHYGHIKVLKDRKARGSCIVVWSSGGYAWAAAVVKALGLQDYVDFCMTKPHLYMDDKTAKEIMGERLYIPYGDGYGQN
jgi:FMN phosphatase YigB (HAD superfamily)